jgi:large subunit ribosomal protein L31
VPARDKITMEDGRELPLFKLDTSSESHPFYTGTQKSVNDMGGRVDKFFKKFGKTAAK